MTRYFITRHPGALDWATYAGFSFDIHHTHVVDIAHYSLGDVVAGTLPVNMVAELCRRGVVYLHLSLDLPEALRGQELDAKQLYACNARLEEFMVLKLAQPA